MYDILVQNKSHRVLEIDKGLPDNLYVDEKKDLKDLAYKSKILYLGNNILRKIKECKIAVET